MKRSSRHALHHSFKPSADTIFGLKKSVQLGGNNPKWAAITEDGTKYVVKWSKNNMGLIPEINEREELTSVFGAILSVPIVSAWTIPAGMLRFEPTQPNEPEAPLIRDKCVIQTFLTGEPIAARPVAAAVRIASNLPIVADLLAFMHWIGDEDRGVSDVMLTNETITFIDNGLCGPNYREDNDRMRSYHPFWEHYSPEAILKKCFPGKPSFVAYIFRDCGLPHELFKSPCCIKRIVDLPDDIIHEVVECSKVNRRVAEVLIRRKRTLIQDYSLWLRDISAFFKC